MEGAIEVSVELDVLAISSIVVPIEIEARSSPSGGMLAVVENKDEGLLTMKMSADDLSTLRAMLNSYMGLLGAAVETARN